MIGTLTGTVKTWNLMGSTRKFGEVTLQYAAANELFMPFRYNALTGKGEQRNIDTPHLRKLKKAMESGDYTPTPGSVSLRKKHRDAIKYETRDDGTETFTLEVDSNDPLPLTDAGHRMEAITAIVKEAKTKLALAKTEKDKAGFQKTIDEATKLPITFTVYLDGDAQRDFVRLQAGRSVDASHLFSLKVQQKVLGEPEYKQAMDIAKHLHQNGNSPFKNCIRFDSRGQSPIPISTLCSKGASDLGTSLLGLARIGRLPTKPFPAETLANCVISAYQELKAKAPEVLAAGKVLTPIGDGGTKGSATMLIGVGICVAQRMAILGLEQPNETILEDLVTVAREMLNEDVSGGFSGPVKRQLMGRFARLFFAADEVAKHDELPVSLLRTLSASAFASTAPPKDVPATETPAVETEVTTESLDKLCETQAEPAIAA